MVHGSCLIMAYGLLPRETLLGQFRILPLHLKPHLRRELMVEGQWCVVEGLELIAVVS